MVKDQKQGIGSVPYFAVGTRTIIVVKPETQDPGRSEGCPGESNVALQQHIMAGK